MPHVVKPRRAGDPAFLVANVSAAQRDLGFRPLHSDPGTVIKTA